MTNEIELTEMKKGYDGRFTRLEVMDFTPEVHDGPEDKPGVYLQRVEGCGYMVYDLTPEQAFALADILRAQAQKSIDAFAAQKKA